VTVIEGRGVLTLQGREITLQPGNTFAKKRALKNSANANNTNKN
jgi:quercetin dioxygenase-like cupin family protein